MVETLDQLRAAIAQCRICAEHLAAGPRPVVQLGGAARILIIGQAPGSKVHASGIPWDDDSGARLRQWLAIEPADFYDPGKVALMPMGFCYPGRGASGDLPPRPECAPKWHDRVLVQLPADRITLLIGKYAQDRYLPEERSLSMTERVRKGTGKAGSNIWALPHPAWRSVGWMQKNPWFERDVLPPLRAAVADRIQAAA